jgi:peptidoglycan/LPS O-acetylase OafA/YrhL
MRSRRDRPQRGGGRAGLIEVALTYALTPVPALAHGPPGWLLVPTGVWLLLSLFILFVGSGVVVAARFGGRGRERERALAAKLAAVLAVSGALLAVVLAAQGPWSVPVAVVAGLVSFALAAFALLAARRPPGRRDHRS